MPDTPQLPPLADDLIGGVAAIAAFINEPERRTNYLLSTRRIPGFKLGARWYIRRSTFLAHIQKLEDAAGGAV